MTLQQIIDKEKKCRHEGGSFGIDACKKSIIFERDHFGKSLFTQLEDFVNRSNNDVFFNKAMVLACWELINEE